MPDTPIFLERRSYRMRRMMDAVRVLPVLGLALWMVPLLWPQPMDAADPAMPMSAALRYVFGVWVLLVLGALILWRRTAAATAAEAAAAEMAQTEDRAAAEPAVR